MVSKVTTWQMTEKERLAYIKKHPIRPTKAKKGSSFANIHDYGERKKQIIKEAKESGKKNKRIIDSVDTDLLHKLFMDGEKLEYIAAKLKISMPILNNYIKEQRQVDPDNWPYRERRKL